MNNKKNRRLYVTTPATTTLTTYINTKFPISIGAIIPVVDDYTNGVFTCP